MKKLVSESLYLYLSESESLNEYDINSRSTGVPNKISEEEETYKVLKDFISKDGFWIGLVGRAVDLERHINQCKNILNIDDSKMIIVERDHQIYNELIVECNKLNYKGQIFNEEFYDVLLKFLDEGYHFSVVDFDGTDDITNSMNLHLVNTYDNYRNQIDILRIIATVRQGNSTSEIKNLITQFKLPKFFQSTNMGQPIKDIITAQCSIPEVLQRIKNDKFRTLKIGKKTDPKAFDVFAYYCKLLNLYPNYRFYKGVSNNMLNFIISKNPLNIDFGKPYVLKNMNIDGNEIVISIAPAPSKAGVYPVFFLIDNKIYYKHFKEVKHIATME